MKPAKTVLITDDDHHHRDILVTLLRYHGYNVLEATTGVEALQEVSRYRPDLVIMDAKLPLLDGWEATRALKRDAATAAIPVIIFTAHVLPRDRDRSREVGCDEYLTKPAEPGRVLEAVRERIGPAE